MLTKEQFDDFEKRLDSLTEQDAKVLFYEVKDLRRLISEIYKLTPKWSAERIKIQGAGLAP